MMKRKEEFEIRKKTIVPKYRNTTIFDYYGNLYDGDQIIKMSKCDDSSDGYCLLRIIQGKLHGRFAVETDTGYFEKWEKGKYISSGSIYNRRTFEKKTTQKEDSENTITIIVKNFHTRNYLVRKNILGSVSRYQV